MSQGQAPGPGVISDEELLAIYRETRNIAVVGASTKVGRPAHDIPAYLRSQGYRILPVNPRGGEIYGERAFTSLAEVDVPIDVVDVFRPPAEALDVAREAAAAGAKVLWYQPGTTTEEAVAAAEALGLRVIRGRCMGTTHARLGLGPGPHSHQHS